VNCERKQISIGKAVCLRVRELMAKNNLTAYRLELDSGINHSTMSFILKGENKSASLRTIIMLSKGFKISPNDFLDSPLFNYENLLDLD
jgi:transcriptional regulator with XRE-family HTH domain